MQIVDQRIQNHRSQTGEWNFCKSSDLRSASSHSDAVQPVLGVTVKVALWGMSVTFLAAFILLKGFVLLLMGPCDKVCLSCSAWVNSIPAVGLFQRGFFCGTQVGSKLLIVLGLSSKEQIKFHWQCQCSTCCACRFAGSLNCSQQQLHVLVKTLARSVTQSPRARYWLRYLHIPPATARPRQRLKKATVSGKSADAQSFIYDTGASAVEILAKKPSNTQK